MQFKGPTLALPSTECTQYLNITGAFQVYQIHNVSSSKPNLFKIDDFINQLMTSKKFSELTDIIAEKAAKKIKSVQKEKEHSSENEFRNTDDTQTEIPESETLKEKVKSRKGVRTSQFGKINTDAFYKQGLKSGEILLNYKHMTAEFERDHKTNAQKKYENLSDRNRGRTSDRDSKTNREKHSEKPKYQRKDQKIQPRKQLKTNKVYEEIERNINKMDKSMNQDSSSAEIKYNNVNKIVKEEPSEVHEIFIKTDKDVYDKDAKLNVKKGSNSNENYSNSDEKNKIDTKSIKYTNSDENIGKNTKAVI